MEFLIQYRVKTDQSPDFFKEFAAALGDRCEEGPEASPMTVIATTRG